MVINARVNPAPIQNIPEKVFNQNIPEKGPIQNVAEKGPMQNISDKGPGHGSRKREEKKVPNKTISSALLMSYEKLPPRFRKKFCEENHLNVEEVESILTNGLPSQDDHNKQQSSYQSRSQTLPSRSGKGRFNEPQRHQEQVFYRTGSNQLPSKTEGRRGQSNSTIESSRRGVEFDIPTKNYVHQDAKTFESNTRENADVSINVKQSFESVVLLPSGTIVSLN